MAQLNVNGTVRNFEAEGDTPLLWVLREQIGLTGTKYGCGVAACGACTVHIDGQPVRSCSTPVSAVTGTRITTNLAMDGQGGEGVEVTRGFGLIEGWEIARKTRGGRMISVSVTLSDWLFRAVMSSAVLTLSRDYFRLRKPLERRIYELARKHCGRQDSWRVSVDTLLKKSGSASPRRVFRAMLRDMIAADHLPDYAMVDDAGDIIRFTTRAVVLEGGVGQGLHLPPLASATHDAARGAAPGWDIYALEADWRAYWAASGRPRLRSPDKAYLGYVRSRTGQEAD